MTAKKNGKGRTGDNKGTEEAIVVPIVRSKMYQRLSPLFLYPDKEFFSLFSSLQNGGSFLEELGSCTEYLRGVYAENSTNGKRTEELWESFMSLEKVIETDVMKHQPVELEEKYIKIFGHTISKECPPYEAQYGTEHMFMKTQEMADIAGFYKAFGLDVSEKMRERVDHISLELEFMHYLCIKEAYSRKNHGKEKTQICVDAQKKFLKDHLGMWAPVFLPLMKQKAGKGFYKEAAIFTEKFLVSELKYLKVKPKKISKPEAQVESPEESNLSFTCGSSGSDSSDCTGGSGGSGGSDCNIN